MALVTLAEVKLQNQITGTDQDILIDQLIENVSALIQSFTGRDFDVTPRTDQILSYEGDGILRLLYSPVINLSNINLNGSDFTQAELDAVKINPSTGTIYLVAGAKDAFFNGDFVINYVSGFIETPKDIKWAAADIIGDMVSNPGASNIKSAKLGDYSFQKFLDPTTTGLPALVYTILKRWSAIN